MLVVLSPAKNLDFSKPKNAPPASDPRMARQAANIARVANKLTTGDIKRLMGVSDALAELNRDRFKAFKLSGGAEDGVQAALCFAGDVYRGLDARSLSKKHLTWAQDRLRILSGLYGVLRPLDAIQPYRLEMGTKLANPDGETLYDFWRPRIAKALNKDADATGARAIVNLASNEYFSAVDKSALDFPVIDVGFKDIKNGKARSIFLFVKRARGLMARWIVENRITDPSRLREFNVEDYEIDADASSDASLVFTRPQPAAKAA